MFRLGGLCPAVRHCSAGVTQSRSDASTYAHYHLSRVFACLAGRNKLRPYEHDSTCRGAIHRARVPPIYLLTAISAPTSTLRSKV